MNSIFVCFSAKPRLKKDAIPSQFSWTKQEKVLAKQREERAAKRAQKKQSLNLSSTSDESKPNAPEPCNEIEIQMTLTEAEEDKQKKVMKCDSSTMTSTPLNSFCIENLQAESKVAELKFYTGFDSFEHFWLVFNILGPAVNHLLYYPSGCVMSVRVLTPANEFLLTVVKLRRNMINKELAFKFDISEPLVSRIFITWINFLYCQFKELNIWVPFQTANQNAKFKGRKCTSTVIIDCTEIKIDQPKNPVSQQLTYSTYKSCNTLKVLVGISSMGSITFVSDSYGGSISDRCLFEKCGLYNLLERNDIVLADRGFNIQDILASKDVNVNIPEFLKKKSGQLEPEQLCRSKILSSNRIHVERIIGLGKTYRILTYLSSNLVPLGSRIVFVCFMLANFRNNIMDGGKKIKK